MAYGDSPELQRMEYHFSRKMNQQAASASDYTASSGSALGMASHSGPSDRVRRSNARRHSWEFAREHSTDVVLQRWQHNSV